MPMRKHHLDIGETTDDQGRPMVVAVGDVDLQTAPLLREHLTDPDHLGREVVVDLRHVRLVDSPGLGILIHSANLQREQGGRLILRGAQGPVRELFDLVRLENIVEVE